MIKVNLKQIVESQEAMRKLSDKQLRGRTAFKMSRLLKKLEAELTTFNETRLKIIEKYAKRNEDGSFMTNEKNEYQFTEEDANKFMEELNKLLEEPIELDANPILLDEIEELDFTPSEMAMLDPFIEE